MSKGDFSSISKKTKSLSLSEFIENASVDGTNEKSFFDPRAKRDFKSIRLAFNEYEYQLLQKAALKENLSLIAYVRSSWMNRAKKDE